MADTPTVGAYIAAQPEAARKALRSVRAAIRKALPDAGEVIAYKMPAYRLAGRIVIYFAAWERHCAIYPAGEQIDAALGEDLARYERSKGTIRFPLDQPVPTELIERIARLLAARAKAKAAARAARRSTPSARARRRS
jgi:uncharacterized protein YdhG (YjbR/CyaY superfamily)